MTVAELITRLDRFDATGDVGLLVDETAVAQVAALDAKVVGDDRGRADTVTLLALARWFLRRHLALPPGTGRTNLQRARLYTGLLAGTGAEVPDDLMPLLDPRSAPHPAESVNDLAITLLEEFNTTGDISRVAAAGQLIESMVGEISTRDPVLARLLNTFSQVAAARFTIDGRATSAGDVVRAAQAAMDAIAEDDPLYVNVVLNLAWSLCVRYDHTADLADLEEAQRLLEPFRADDPRPEVLNALGCVYRHRFERWLRVSDVDQAIALCRDALGKIAPGHPLRPIYVQDLVVCLLRRGDALANVPDLVEAVDLNSSIDVLTGRTGPMRSAWLANHAAMLACLARHTRSMDDLAAAIDVSRQASALARGFEQFVWVQTNHAHLLWQWHVLNGGDLTEAIETCEAAARSVEPESGKWPHTQVMLVRLHTANARAGGATSELDEALRIGRAALARLPSNHPEQMDAIGVLADAHMCRFEFTSDRADLEAAAGLWRSVASTPVGRPDGYFHTARRWAEAARQASDRSLAREALSAAVAALPMLAWRGLDRHQQEERLAGAEGIASEAAALCLELGEPTRAVELVEQGRSVLWAQALQTRTDLSSLRAAAPSLADQLDGTRLALNRLRHVGGEPHAYRRLVEHWEELLTEARQVPGFASFLGATPFDELRHAGAGGPVVIVNVCRWRCDALIVTPAGVRVVPLRWLTAADVHRRARGLLAALNDTGTAFGSVHFRQTLGSLLRWLWDTIAEPVLTELGQGPHRVWWCPTGPLTLLPLHAAGRHGRRPGRTLLDQTISSYATSLTALIRARNRTVPTRSTSLLAIGMPRTPGHPPLPSVVRELGHIARLMPGTEVLIDWEATPDAVLRAVTRHPWVHFASHATQHVDHPGQSAIHLHGGDLSILRLAEHDLGNAEFAYLSACHTASGTAKLADEAIHLAAALQLAGYRHVIGTQWSVADHHAASAADRVYTGLMSGGTPDAASSAHALTAAMRTLRDEHPDRPDVWAPYIHIGP